MRKSGASCTYHREIFSDCGGAGTMRRKRIALLEIGRENPEGESVDYPRCEIEQAGPIMNKNGL